MSPVRLTRPKRVPGRLRPRRQRISAEPAVLRTAAQDPTVRATKRRRLADNKLDMRLAVERTLEDDMRRIQCQLFTPPLPVEAPGAPPPCRPAPRLSAVRILIGGPLLVAGTLHRRSAPMAGVVPFVPNDDSRQAVWNQVTTVRPRDL